MDEVTDAWKRYAEACCEHDEREGRLALSHLVPEQRQEEPEVLRLWGVPPVVCGLVLAWALFPTGEHVIVVWPW